MRSTPKRYLLDTSVILDDPANILRLFDDSENYVYITDIVLAELNNRKEDAQTEAGYRAREFFRLVDNNKGHSVTRKILPDLPDAIDKTKTNKDRYYQLTATYQNADASQSQPVEVPLFVIYRPHYRITNSYTEKYGLNDAKIAEIADDYGFILVTNDIAFKIAAQVEGIASQSLRNASVENPDELMFDTTIYYADPTELTKRVELPDFTQVTLIQKSKSSTNEEYQTGVTQFAIVVNGQLEMCDFDRRFGDKFSPMRVRPINVEQKFFYTILSHPLNNVIVVSGSTGSGKTLIALQAGLEMIEDGTIEGIVYARNTVTASDRYTEMGFRKGDQSEKLGYFMYPLYSAINFTIEHMKGVALDPNVEFSGNTNSVKKETATTTFMEKHSIEVMDIAHLRGTTISKKLVIIDEAQNMTNATMKLIGTRMGEGTKLCVIGDPKQIDHPFLSRRRNALVALMKKALNDSYVAGIQLRHTIRSETAQWFDENF
ncbi:MAG: PhoH-family protein [Sulfuricurvum sp. PC08-66]|nr:MAG: PhoH-family protein [Sulfuricurvum sp. PC08-66]